MSYAKTDGRDDAARNSWSFHPQNSELTRSGETTRDSLRQEREELEEEAKLEAQRESNCRSAKNGRLRKKNHIATLEAENQFLRTELKKALIRIEHLKLTLEQETKLALDNNRCLQILVENHIKNQNRGVGHDESLRTFGIGNSVSSKPTLSGLLETSHPLDSTSFDVASNPSSRHYQGYGQGIRQQDEQTRDTRESVFSVNSHVARATNALYTRPSSTRYPSGNAVERINHRPMNHDNASVGRPAIRNSYSTVAELKRLSRLQEELKILKSRTQG